MTGSLVAFILVGLIGGLIAALARLAVQAGRAQARAEEAERQRETIEDLARRSEAIQAELMDLSDAELRNRVSRP